MHLLHAYLVFHDALKLSFPCRHSTWHLEATGLPSQSWGAVCYYVERRQTVLNSGKSVVSISFMSATLRLQEVKLLYLWKWVKKKIRGCQSSRIGANIFKAQCSTARIAAAAGTFWKWGKARAPSLHKALERPCPRVKPSYQSLL